MWATTMRALVELTDIFVYKIYICVRKSALNADCMEITVQWRVEIGMDIIVMSKLFSVREVIGEIGLEKLTIKYRQRCMTAWLNIVEHVFVHVVVFESKGLDRMADAMEER